MVVVEFSRDDEFEFDRFLAAFGMAAFTTRGGRVLFFLLWIFFVFVFVFFFLCVGVFSSSFS